MSASLLQENVFTSQNIFTFQNNWSLSKSHWSHWVQFKALADQAEPTHSLQLSFTDIPPNRNRRDVKALYRVTVKTCQCFRQKINTSTKKEPPAPAERRRRKPPTELDSGSGRWVGWWRLQWQHHGRPPLQMHSPAASLCHWISRPHPHRKSCPCPESGRSKSQKVNAVTSYLSFVSVSPILTHILFLICITSHFYVRFFSYTLWIMGFPWQTA